ncbi:hypothetical protein [Sphingopyxis chilensis]
MLVTLPPLQPGLESLLTSPNWCDRSWGSTTVNCPARTMVRSRCERCGKEHAVLGAEAGLSIDDHPFLGNDEDEA